MGWDITAVATKLPVPELRGLFLRLWPEEELVTSASAIRDFEAVYRWKGKHEVFVSAADWTPENPGREVKAFYVDGEWSVLLEFGCWIAAYEVELAHISRLTRQVVVLGIGTHAGVAFLDVYECSQRIRRIVDNSGRIATEGEPLANEQGIDLHRFYLDGADALWRSFGLRSILAAKPIGPFEAICVSHRRSHGESHQTPEPGGRKPPGTSVSAGGTMEVPSDLPAGQGKREATTRRKQWWKLW